MQTSTSPRPTPTPAPRPPATSAAQVLGIVASVAALCYAGMAAWCWIAEETYDGESLGIGYVLAIGFAVIAAVAGLGGGLGLGLARVCPRTAAVIAAVGLAGAVLPPLFFALPVAFG